MSSSERNREMALAPFFNLIPNKGDILNNVDAVRVVLTRQELKIEDFLTFKNQLKSEGFAQAFYERFLWLIPIDGKGLKESQIRKIIQKFTEKLDLTLETVKILNFRDVYLWFNVGLPLLRGALEYALYYKFKGIKNMVVRGLRVHNKNFVVDQGMFTYTVVGVSLSRIFKIGLDNIGICPTVDFEVLDESGRKIENTLMKQTYVSKASRINMKKYYDYLDKLLSDILPISVNFSNKSIIFNKEFHKIPFAEETLPRRQERLGRWF